MKKETKRLIAAGLIALLGAGVAYADDTLDRTVTANFPEETDAYKNDKTVTNKFIKLTAKATAATATATNWLGGADAYEYGTLNLGGDNTESITINTENMFASQSSNVDGILAIAFTPSENDKASIVNVKTKKLQIDVKGADAAGMVAALRVQSGWQEENAPANAASLTVKADEIVLNSSQIGICAFSNGQMNINGNLTVNAKNALDVRGRSTTKINTDGKHSTVLNGDIVFETPATPQNYHNSGNIIDAYVNVNLTGKDSSWTGSAYQAYKKNETDSDYQHVIEMDAQPFQGNVTGFKLTMADGASWNMTGDSFVNDVTASSGSTIHVGSDVKKANMQNVTLNDATIDLAGDQQRVNVTKKLTGNGTIATNSLNNKLKAENASDANITVKGTGNIADLIASDSKNAQKLADTAVGADGKTTIAKNIKASAATIAGDYEAQVDENGKVVNEVKSQNQTNLSISKLGALSLMTWRQENNDMNKRLGEIRDSQGEQGIWARMSRGEAKYGAQGVKNQYNYYQLGYDHKIADDWILGGAFTYTDGENNLVGGSGTNKNTGFAVYGSNLRDDGSFIDLIAKYAHMKNDFDTIGGVGIGEYSTNGYALSAEYGKRFQQDGFWIEPQAELTYGKVSSADFTTSEGAKVHQDSLDSLVGRLGFSLGKDVKAGNVYVRASYLYDFKGDVAMRMSNGVASDTYDQDLGGSWWEFGVGTNLNFGKDMHFYFDVERTEGGKVDTPWQWNAGVRLSF